MRTDTRHILVDKNGIRLSKSSTAPLCDYCSVYQDCHIRPMYFVERCEHFVPALSFSEGALKGISGTFSTMRFSALWGARAQSVMNTHGMIGLASTQDGSLISLAEVISYQTARFSDLISRHAASNHLTIAAKIPDTDAPIWLTRQIKNIVGSRYVNNLEQIATVIYVRTKEETQPT